MTLKGNEISTALKLDNLLLEEKVHIKLKAHIQNKITVQNVSTFHQLAKIYNVTNLTQITLSFIERFFTTVVETENFSQLEYTLVRKIFLSSELSLHSELEVINAANKWLGHNINGRSKFAKQLLLTVRLYLLSDPALKFTLDNYISFSEDTECVNILEEVLLKKNKYLQYNPINDHTSRYCSQDKYNILMCGGYSMKLFRKATIVKQIYGNDFNTVKFLPSMITERRINSKAVCLKGEAYIFGGCNVETRLVTNVEKYSPSSKIWSKIGNMYDDRVYFSVCAFMDKIFIIGGSYYENGIKTLYNYCLEFDTKSCKWIEVAGMKEKRNYAASVVFEGRIVVSGGRDNNGDDLNTVEAYDVIANKWTLMSYMINGKSKHSLVVVRSKLFVIGRYKCEVFDNICKKFAALRSPYICYFNNAIPIGNKIVIIQDGIPSVNCYDVENDTWYAESCEGTTHCVNYCSVKLPWY